VTLSTDIDLLNDAIAKEDWQAAMNIYQGPFLEGINTSLAGEEIEEWIFKQREQQASKISNVMVKLAELEASQENYEAAAQQALNAYYLKYAPEPNDETLQRLYLVLTAAKHPLEAEIKQQLSQTPDFQALSREEAKKTLKQQRHFIKATNPYKGLAYFEENDSKYFFGREEEIASITKKLMQPPHLVTLTGSSGSGKSSLVNAGIKAQLKQNVNCHMLSFRPNQNAFLMLAINLLSILEPQLSTQESYSESQALALTLKENKANSKLILDKALEKTAKQKLIIIIDQLEELFSSPNKKDISLFLNTLMNTSSQNIAILMVLRADFLNEALSYIQDIHLLQSSHYLLGPISKENLKTVITQPAKLQNVKLEAGLADRILSDLEEQTNNLPLLQFSMTQLWDEQENGILKHKAYDHLGGVAKSIAQHAERIWSTLNQKEQQDAQHIFMRLVTSTPNQADTKKLALKEELKEYWPVVSKLASYPARLLVITINSQKQETIEMIHEALIMHWQRLQLWLQEDRAARLWKEHFNQDYRLWQEQQSDTTLLQNYRLEQAQRMRASHQKLLNTQEINYINKSQEKHEQQQHEKEQLQQQQIDTLKRLAQNEKAQRQADQARLNAQRTAVRLLSLAGILSIILISFLINTRNQAIQAQQLAEQQKQISINTLAEMISSKVNTNENKPEKNLLLAIEAYQAATQPQTINRAKGTLLQLINQTGGQRLSHNDRVLAVDFHPTEQQFITTTNDSMIHLWHLEDLQSTPIKAQKSINAEQGVIFSAKFSPNGKWLATAGENNSIKLWLTSQLNTENPQASITLNNHTDAVFSLAFNQDGSQLAAGSFDKSFSIYQENNNTWQQIHHSQPLDQRIRSLSFSPTQAWLIVGSGRQNQGQLYLYNSQSLNQAPQILSTNAIRASQFSPDGTWLATSNENNELKLWNTQNMLKENYQPLLLNGHSDFSTGLAFSNDGQWLASSARDQSARLWFLEDANKEKPIRSLKLIGHEDWLAEGISFSPDNKWLLTSSIDKSARLWNLTYPGIDLTTYPIQGAPIRTMALSEDEENLALGNLEGEVSILKLSNLTQPPTVITKHSSWVESITYNENTLISTSNYLEASDTLKITNTETKTPLPIPQLPAETYFDTQLNPQDSSLIVSSQSGNLQKISLENPQAVQLISQEAAPITALALSPDGKQLATAGFDTHVTLWNTQNYLQAPILLQGHNAAVRSLTYHPNGQYLATGDVEGKVLIWSLDDLTQEPQSYTLDVINIWSLSYYGQDLVISSENQTIHVIQEGQILELNGHTAGVYQAVTSKNEQWLITASEDATLKFWLQPKNLIELACQKAGRNLSPEEWRDVFIDTPYKKTCPEY